MKHINIDGIAITVQKVCITPVVFRADADGTASYAYGKTEGDAVVALLNI